jgi:hypothetical protein
LNGWDGWAFGQPNHPYPAATWGASHYRNASDRFIGTQVLTQSPRRCTHTIRTGSPHTRKVRRGKGGQALRPPLNTHISQSGLQETFWYHQEVSDENPHAGSDTKRGAAPAALWDSFYQHARYRCIDSTLPRHVNVAS